MNWVVFISSPQSFDLWLLKYLKTFVRWHSNIIYCLYKYSYTAAEILPPIDSKCDCLQEGKIEINKICYPVVFWTDLF